MLLPDGARVRARQRRARRHAGGGPRSAERLAALRARRRRRRQRAARDVRDARRRRSRRRAAVQALLRFTTALGRAERTAPVANVVHRDESVVERVSYTFSPRYNAYSFAPRFGSLQTQIDAARRRRARPHRSRVARHARAHDPASSAMPIRHRSRRATAARFPDNYALSAARAQAVADYLRAALPDGAHRGRRPRRRRADRRGRGAPTASRAIAASRSRSPACARSPSAEWRIVTAERASRPPSRRRARSAATPDSAAARARVGAAGRRRGGARARDRRGDARAAARDPAAERRLRAAGADRARRDRALARTAGAARASTADPSAS